MNALVAEMIERAGLAHQTEQIERLLLRSIHLTTHRVEMEGLGLGASRIGGVPDLPTEMEWPVRNGVPMSFLAQIHLPDLARYNQSREEQVRLFDVDRNDVSSVLPPSGWLYFFYAAEQPWGYDPAHRGGWRVLFHDGDTARLCRTAAPRTVPGEGIYFACGLSFTEEFTLPALDAYAARFLDLSRSDEEAYRNLIYDIKVAQVGQEPSHRLLGHPLQVQGGDMQLVCQLASHGLYCGDEGGYLNPLTAQLETGAGEWQLLFQIETDDNAAMMWGDVGSVYFWMPQQALQERRFDEVWLVLQCH